MANIINGLSSVVALVGGGLVIFDVWLPSEKYTAFFALWALSIGFAERLKTS